MTHAWTMASTTPATIMHQRYPDGGAHLRLDLRGPAPLVQDCDEYLERCRTSLASSPEAVAYRRAVEQTEAARSTLDKIQSETAEAQAKRAELLDGMPASPSEKQLAAVASADRKAEQLRSRTEDAQHALRMLQRRAADARSAVEAAAQRIGREVLATFRHEVQDKWDALLAQIPAVLAPHLDALLTLDAMQASLGSDGARARQAALLVHELPPLPAVEPEPVPAAGPTNDDEDGEDGVLPLASAG